MKGNTFGRIFRISTWGESHGAALGVLVDGCPAGISLEETDFSADIAMRQGGNSPYTTPRKEADLVQIESGVFAGKTLGTPIALRIANANVKSGDYEKFREIPRPGHADLTTHWKHGHRDHRGGGRSSARETVARVAAGVIAKKILATRGVQLLGFVRSIGPLEISTTDLPFHSESTERILSHWWPFVEQTRSQNSLRLPTQAAGKFEELALRAREEGDSWGGSVECWVRGLPAGLGEPVFDKLNAVLSHALLSLPAAVATEVGGGASMSREPGSRIRDAIIPAENGLRVGGNHHGGLLGGMTTGEPLWMRVHFHGPTSLPREIASVDLSTGDACEISVGGRHDSVPLPRAVPMVEAMAAITLVDAIALHSSL